MTADAASMVTKATGQKLRTRLSAGTALLTFVALTDEHADSANA